MGNTVKGKMDKLGNLGGRIRLVRERLGLNQADFAEKLGLSGPSPVSKYELGQREPDMATLIDIAGFSNRGIEWLVTGDDPVVEKPAEEAMVGRVLQGLTTLERIYVERLLEIIRTRDHGAVSEITHNIDMLLRASNNKNDGPQRVKKGA